MASIKRPVICYIRNDISSRLRDQLGSSGLRTSSPGAGCGSETSVGVIGASVTTIRTSPLSSASGVAVEEHLYLRDGFTNHLVIYFIHNDISSRL
jgi:hypothetical protein